MRGKIAKQEIVSIIFYREDVVGPQNPLCAYPIGAHRMPDWIEHLELCFIWTENVKQPGTAQNKTDPFFVATLL